MNAIDAIDAIDTKCSKNKDVSFETLPSQTSQTSQTSPYVPLLFWYNKDTSLALPEYSIRVYQYLYGNIIDTERDAADLKDVADSKYNEQDAADS